MIAKPEPSPSPTGLHLNLQHLHVSPSLVIGVVVLMLLALLAGAAQRARGRGRASRAAPVTGDSSGGWGNLSGGQDVAIILLAMLVLGGMAYVLPFASFIFAAVTIGVAVVVFTVLRIFGAGPLIAKWRRGVNKDGKDVWKQVY